MTSAELDGLLEDLRSHGAPEEIVEAAVARMSQLAAPAVFLVHPDNVNAVKLFIAMSTQWNAVALTTLERAEIRRTGLRYEVLDRVARGAGIAEQDGDFDRLQLMEAEALLAWAEARA